MTARDELAKLLFTTDNRDAPDPDHEWEMTSRHNPPYAEAYYIMADAILAAGYRKPRQVTTVEELDALPVGTIVLDSERDVCERMSFGWFVIVKEEGSSPWLLDGAEDVELPATVLHVGSL